MLAAHEGLAVRDFPWLLADPAPLSTPDPRNGFYETLAAEFARSASALEPTTMREVDDSYTEGCLYGDAAFNCRVKSFTTVDLTGAYDVTEKATVYADVMNLFDTGPMFNPANYAGVNWNPTYSQSGIVGRYFRVGVRLKY